MSVAIDLQEERGCAPELAYALLKAALALYQRPPAELSAGEWARARAQAQRQHALEARVLAASAARGVRVPRGKVHAALESLAARYAGRDEFLADLERNGISEADLGAALERELLVEAVLDRIGRMAPAVSDQDVEIFFYQHAERFTRPERRTVRHLLITINDQFTENRREAARGRIDALARALAEGADFADLARRHSECPTALEGGLVGTVPAGKLYPELDAVLFRLGAGEVSTVVESAIGFHLLLCDAIEPESRVPLGEAAVALRERLQSRARQRYAEKWLAGLAGS